MHAACPTQGAPWGQGAATAASVLQSTATMLPTSMIPPIWKRPQAKTWPRLPFFCGLRRTASQHSSSMPTREFGPRGDLIGLRTSVQLPDGMVASTQIMATPTLAGVNRISRTTHTTTLVPVLTFTSPKAVTPSRAPLPRGTATRCREICCFSRLSRNSGPACVKVHGTGCGKYGERVSFSPFYLFIFPSPRVFIIDQVWR